MSKIVMLNNNTIMKNGVSFKIPSQSDNKPSLEEVSKPSPTVIKGINLNRMNNNFDAFLRVYRSPDNEQSIAKNIPMHFLKLYYAYGKLNGHWRIKYRGPSIPGVYNRPQAHCKRQFATSFAIYERRLYDN